MLRLLKIYGAIGVVTTGAQAVRMQRQRSYVYKMVPYYKERDELYNFYLAYVSLYSGLFWPHYYGLFFQVIGEKNVCAEQTELLLCETRKGIISSYVMLKRLQYKLEKS